MTYRKRLAATLVLLLAALAFGASAAIESITRTLAPGVTLTQEITSAPDAPLIVNAVTVDLARPGIAVKAAIGQDTVYADDWRKGREIISSLTARKKALVGVNADFFPFTGDPLGVCIVDGELVSEAPGNRAAIAVTRDRKVFFDIPRTDAKLTLASSLSRQIDGINRARETNQVVLYTPTFGASTRDSHKATDVLLTTSDLPVRAGKPISATVSEVKLDATDTAIPTGGIVLSGGGPASYFLSQNLKQGDTVTIRFDIAGGTNCDWTQVEQAASGGPWLVKDGADLIDLQAESMGSAFSTTKHPRTAAGLTADNKLVLVTVDGRQWNSGGIALPDLAALMRRLGCANAINLDGGGSTTLSVKGLVINTPSEGQERPVANGLLVFADRPCAEELPKLTVSGIGELAVSGQSAQAVLTWGGDAQMLTEDQGSNVVWGTTGGVGFVDQKGNFYAYKVNKGTLSALYGSQLATASLAVAAGPPYKIKIDLATDKQDPTRSAAKLTLLDLNVNPIPGKGISIEVTGGAADAATGTTNEKGELSIGITWDPAAPEQSVKATADTITATVANPKPPAAASQPPAAN